MGFSAQVQSAQTGQTGQSTGKGSPIAQGMPNTSETTSGVGYNPTGGAPHQAMGKGGAITNSATSGQPRIGQPNAYPNTVGMGDNTQQQPNQAQAKGKGA